MFMTPASGSNNAYSTISNNISYSTNAAGIAGLPAGFITNNSTFPTLILQQVPGGNGVQAYSALTNLIASSMLA